MTQVLKFSLELTKENHLLENPDEISVVYGEPQYLLQGQTSHMNFKHANANSTSLKYITSVDVWG